MPARHRAIESRRHNSAARKASDIFVESLEARRLLSVNVLTFHNDTTNGGANTSELQLTPTNVKVGTFGKLFATTLDGQVYGEPLVDTGVTVEGGVHNIVVVATENDSLYAIDSGTGVVLWQRSFITTSESNGILNNPLGASSITSVTSADVSTQDINPTVGITSTPVIDSARNLIYVVAATKEVINSKTYFVQRLHAINISNGTDTSVPFLIGETNYTVTNGTTVITNNTPIYVYGDGDGYVTDPYNGTGKAVVQFNALTANQRAALTLVNNTVYVAFASHGDNGPYHGWVAAWSVADVATTGFALTGVLNTCPNDGESGVWQGGGGLVFEPDGSAFYFLTGNGTGEAPTDGSNDLPEDADYNEALVKAQADPTTSPKNQNPNGWGLKIVSSFTPYNVAALDGADSDFGSGAPMLIPTPVDINGVEENVIVAGGKDGRIFVLNRNDLGGYNATSDAAFNSVANGSGDNTPPQADAGTLSSPAYFNGDIYVSSGYSGPAYEYTINSAGQLTVVSQTPIDLGYEPGSPSISSDGTSNGIVWITDRNTNELHAYSASSLNDELWNSAQAVGGADDPGALVKFATPTIANGEVLLGTTDQLVAYGLTPAAATVSDAPVLAATTLSGSAVNLTWSDSSLAPNTASAYLILESTNDTSFSQMTTAPAGATSIGVGGLSPSTTYYFEIEGYNNIGDSAPSNIVSAKTTSSSAGVNFSNGFSAAASTMALSGNAAINGSNLELTNGNLTEAGSAFTDSVVDVTSFTSQFTFQISAGTNTADGLTFTLQDQNAYSLGTDAGSLGYAGIGNSVAIKFDLYSNNGEGPDSTGVYSNGDVPENLNSIDLSSTGINLHSGDPIQANLAYNGTTLTVVLTDTVTQATATQTYTVNIPQLIGSGTAYAGFTGGTGGLTAIQNIQNWTYTPGDGASPNAPSGLGATPTTATSVTLNWTNNALNQTSFQLDRATDSGFTQNLITQPITETVPVGSTSYIDTAAGLATNETFYYRIRAANAVGASGNSNSASVTIPASPAKATGQEVTGVSTSEVDMTWQDNAGHSALGYHILRATNQGSFTLVATLPPTSRTAPSTYAWADTTVTPGNYYEYHIEAYNSSGYNDFAGANATTLTLAPTGVTALQSGGGVTIAWSPVTAFGGVTYNIYRGTSPGGEGSIPLYTGITTTSYPDSAPPAGTTYYYKVTAVNTNTSYTPPLPSESAQSTEASTAGGSSSTPDQLTGIPSANTTSSYDGKSTDTYTAVFDGNTSTYWDAPTANGNYVQLNLGAADTITSIAYAPRVGFEYRMVGGVFEASNDPTFSTGVVTLNTVTASPSDGLTTRAVSPNGTYQYIRYVSPAGSYGNIAEMQIFGTASATPFQLSPTATSANTTSSYDGKSTDTYTAVFDGNTSTYWDAPAANGNWVQANLGAADTITSIAYAPRVGFEYRMVGGVFEASNDPTFSTGIVTLYTVTAVPTDGLTTQAVSPGGSYQYIRYVTPAGSYGDIAEMQMFGTTATGTGGAGSTPTATSGPTATFSATGITAALAVTASETGNPALTYTWSAASLPAGVSAAPTYSSTNGTTGGNAVTGSFLSAGTYVLDVKITDPSNNSIVVPLTLTVGQVLTSITITPSTTPVSVPAGGTEDFSASGNDQFDDDMDTDPTFTWSLVAGSAGSIDATTGVYTASTTVGNTATVTASAVGTAGTVVGSQPVKVVAAAAPDAPGTPTLTSATSSAVVVAWMASTSSNVTGYDVLRNGGQIGTTSSTTLTYTDNTVNASTAYSYTVKAVNGNAVSAPSGALPVNTPAASSGPVQLTGSASANTTSSYDGKSTDTYTAVLDGNTSTYWDAPTANGNYLQLNLGAADTITSIAYAPRVGFEYRMVGGVFEASNDPTFTTGVVTLFTVTATPPDGLTTQAVSPGGNCQYIRYVSPAGSYGNIAEMQVFGTVPAAPRQLTPTATSANTTSSYDGLSTDNYTAAFDGNTNTYFDAPAANGNWIQANLGSPRQITSIAYTPRVGFEYRMVGGIFEVSNDPTFSTGVTVLYTITATPSDGLTTQSVSVTGTYQYVRYVAPAGSYGDIAEMQVFGY